MIGSLVLLVCLAGLVVALVMAHRKQHQTGMQPFQNEEAGPDTLLELQQESAANQASAATPEHLAFEEKTAEAGPSFQVQGVAEDSSAV